MDSVSFIDIATAFGIGFLTFISPCILPVIPSYLAYISGTSFEELSGENVSPQVRKRTVTHSIMFVIGFSIIFTALGATASLIGSFLKAHIDVITKIAGFIVFFFGLHLAGVIKLTFLMQEHRMEVKEKPAGLIGSLLVGMAFGAGWTPCVGPMLGTAFALASTKDTMWAGVILLFAFSLGLGIPFILSALAFNSFMTYSAKFRRHLETFTKISGVFLMIIGITLFMGWFSKLSTWIMSMFPSAE